MPCSELNPIVMEVDVVEEPSRALVSGSGVGPNLESELNLTGIVNVGNRRHRDVARDPSTVSG